MIPIKKVEYNEYRSACVCNNSFHRRRMVSTVAKKTAEKKELTARDVKGDIPEYDN